jgi:hypothetical protein
MANTERTIANLDNLNRGAVHRYYAKPWVPTALRSDIHDAFRHFWMLHDVREERRELELAAVMSTVPPPRSLR